MKNKYVFLGDINSINVEIISKSYPALKNKLKYILLGNINDLNKYLLKIKSQLKINEILNPLDFGEFNGQYLNIFNIENINSKKYKNLLNQLAIANTLCNATKYDLVTMPINKQVFKKYIRFIGNRRLEQLGLEPIYDVKKNPLVWLDTMLNGVEHMNFFEGRATEYSKASTQGTWGEVFA